MNLQAKDCTCIHPDVKCIYLITSYIYAAVAVELGVTI